MQQTKHTDSLTSHLVDLRSHHLATYQHIWIIPLTSPLTMGSIILNVLHTAQAAFGAYNLYLASISISNLQQYEEKSEKAAKYSNVAENQLHKTRTTQASGTIAVIIPLPG